MDIENKTLEDSNVWRASHAAVRAFRTLGCRAHTDPAPRRKKRSLSGRMSAITTGRRMRKEMTVSINTGWGEYEGVRVVDCSREPLVFCSRLELSVEVDSASKECNVDEAVEGTGRNFAGPRKERRGRIVSWASEKAPMRFCIACILACQSAVPSLTFSGTGGDPGAG